MAGDEPRPQRLGVGGGRFEQALPVCHGSRQVHAALAERAGHGVHEGQRCAHGVRAFDGVRDDGTVVGQGRQGGDDVRPPLLLAAGRGGRAGPQQQRPRARPGGGRRGSWSEVAVPAQVPARAAGPAGRPLRHVEVGTFRLLPVAV